MSSEDLDPNLHSQLTSRYTSFVLITCTAPSKEGKMQVNLTYECDETLAAYLIQTANCIFDPEKVLMKERIESYFPKIRENLFSFYPLKLGPQGPNFLASKG